MLSVRERLFSMEFLLLSRSGRSATSAKASEGVFTDVAALDYTNNSHSMYCMSKYHINNFGGLVLFSLPPKRFFARFLLRGT